MTTEQAAFVYRGYRVHAFTSQSPYRKLWAWVTFDLVTGVQGGHPRHLVPGEFYDEDSALAAAYGYARRRIDKGEVWS